MWSAVSPLGWEEKFCILNKVRSDSSLCFGALGGECVLLDLL